MASDPISLQRRRLLIAGVATPATALAGTGALAAPVGPLPGDRLVVSGRVLDAGGKPLAGALVEAWHASATTDADGRFVLVGQMPGSGPSEYRVTHGTRSLALRALPAQLQRDEGGTWRSALGIALA